ncbi:MAG: hypothetical protein HC852_10315 [Acaryochloridaceae cyanobacterium RU_4_10]|nr:hypothetical protein [Acaryochloridaceae cyanobacterium RU_4_10]
MNSETFFQRYEGMYDSLKVIIESSEKRVLGDNDDLFSENINFFIKSYLITICTYLEAFLQDIAFEYANELNSRLKDADIPHNFVHWRIVKDIKDKELNFNKIDFSVDKKEISDNLSANPYKTIKLFKRQFKSEVQQVLMDENKILRKAFDSQGIFSVCD